MSDAAASAPAAPAPSAPASAPSSSGAPASPVSNAPAPPSGAQTPPAAPPTREPVPWKTKARIGEQEHELELDVSPFLAEYKRKLKLDGEEVEVGLDDAFKSYERAKPSFKRFEEAAQMRRDAEAERTRLKQQVEAIEGHLTDPARAPQVMRKALGPKYTAAVLADLRQSIANGDHEAVEGIAEIVRERLEYEKLPPEQRQQRDQMTAAERRAAEREAQLAQREREIARREAETKAAHEKRIDQLAQERRAQLVAEWTPALEKAGLPTHPRIMAMLAQTLRHAKDNAIPLTLPDAVSQVREEYEALVGHAVQQRQQATTEAVQQQPGRGEPAAPAAAPRVRQPNGQFGRAETAEDFARRLRQSWVR